MPRGGTIITTNTTCQMHFVVASNQETVVAVLPRRKGRLHKQAVICYPHRQLKPSRWISHSRSHKVETMSTVGDNLAALCKQRPILRLQKLLQKPPIRRILWMNPWASIHSHNKPQKHSHQPLLTTHYSHRAFGRRKL